MTAPSDHPAQVREALERIGPRLLAAYRAKDGITRFAFADNERRMNAYMREALEEIALPAIVAALASTPEAQPEQDGDI